MQKYLVTGCMGFVGSHLTERLLRDGKTVFGIDIALNSFSKKLRDFENFTFVEGSIQDVELLRTLINKVDVVCHLAAIANPEEYTSFPRKVMDVTLLSGLDIVRLCRLSGKLLFFTSTSEIYGKNPKVPFSEDDDRVLGSTRINRWCYSSSKAAVEHYIYATAQEGHLNYIVTRLFNVYGPRIRGRVIEKFVKKALNGEDLLVHGDGKQTRCFTYIDDAIDAFVGLMSNPKAYNDCYNVGTHVEHNIEEVANLMKEIAHEEIKVVKIAHETLYGKSYEDIPRRVPNTDKIKEAIGWQATTSLKEGLKRTYEYHKDFGIS